jgi:hypothetical protein
MTPVSPDNPAGSTSQSGQAGAAFCFRVKQERPGWNILYPRLSKTTVDLAALVCGAPEFLGMGSGDAPCQAAVVLSERGEARVVAAVDEFGGITLVGCPGKLTRDALTTVVQELIVFSGRLWRMPSEEFSSVFEKRLGHSLGDYFSNRAAIGWSENGFRTGLGRNLERGRFPVVLLLSDSNQEVVEAVAHLKSHNMEVKSLGVELYESSGVEIVMPRLLDVARPEPREEREPAKPVSRPAQYEPRTPTRPLPSTAGPAVAESVQRPEPAPAKKMPWSDEPAPPVAEAEPPVLDHPDDTSVSVSPASTEIAPEMPWSAEPAPAEPVVVPPPVQTKPVSAVPPPAPRPAAAKPSWDGTMPGVMAGKRPPRRMPEVPGTTKGREQSKDGGHWR